MRGGSRLGLLTVLALVGFPAGFCRAATAGEQPFKVVISLEPAELAPAELIELGADPFGRTPDGRLYFRVSQQILDELTARGRSFVIEEEDIYVAWERQRSQRAEPRDVPFQDYHNLAATEAIMQRFVQEHPDLAALEVIGTSVEGRSIYALRLSDEAEEIDLDEPAVLVVGCHHAREWISVEVPLYFADYLLENYLKDGVVTRLLNYTEIWIVPVLNPDGYQYSWTTDRWWRKNRRNNGDGTIGVDINRNYGYEFEGAGSSDDPASYTYRGSSAFSEPETQAMRNLLDGTTFGRTFQGGLSYHNYSQVVIFPWGYTYDEVENVQEYEWVSGNMVNLINAGHSNPQYDYVAGQGSHLLYNTNGDFGDWVHGTLGIMALTVELRPAGAPYFELPANEIIPTCAENLPAFLYFAEERMIPDVAESDSDGDGFVDEDDYCVDSPAGAAVDTWGCAESEQDLDEDGVENTDDLCRDSLPGQQVDDTGCRVTPLFSVAITANIESVDVEVEPADIDAYGEGNTGNDGFVREYAAEETLILTAPRTVRSNIFDHWLVNEEPGQARQNGIFVTGAADVTAQAVYTVPVGVQIAGPARMPDKYNGLNFIAEFTLEIIYSDDSTGTVAEGVTWFLGAEAVGTLTEEGGQLIVHNVTSEEGEVVGTISASVDLGDGLLEASPFEFRVFDAETQDPWCVEVTLEGPAEVASLSEATYEASVSFDQGPVPAVNPEALDWDLLPPAGDESDSLPASISDAGVLTTLWVAEDTPIVVRGVYPNAEGTVCTAELTVTILGGAGDGDPGPGNGATCGAMGLVGLLGTGLGLAALRPGRR